MDKKQSVNTAPAVSEIEKKIGYSFKDKSLLMQALTRSSWCNEHRDGYQSNEVLEFFGDGVLSVAIISCLLTEKTARNGKGIHTELTEGDLSVIKSRLSDKKKLSECTERLGLEKHLRLGEGDRKLGVMKEPSVMEDLFESIIGAVYIDSGMNLPTVIKVVRGMLDISEYLNTATTQSPKNLLQEYCADKKRRLPQPEYKTVKEEGPDHKKVYTRAVLIGGRRIAEAEGKNQKLADIAAAAKALEVLKSEESTAEVAPEKESKGAKAPARKNAPSQKAQSNRPAQPTGNAKGARPQAHTPRAEAHNEEKPTEYSSDDDGGISFTPSLSRDGRTERAKSFAEYLERLVGESAEKQTNVYNNADKPYNGSEILVNKGAKSQKTSSQMPTKKSNASTVQIGNKNTKAQSASVPDSTKKRADKLPSPAIKSESDTQQGDTCSMKLKTVAQSKKLPSPTYSDLGQIKENGEVKYRVECRFNGESSVGVGKTRLLAKSAAAEVFLKRLKGTPDKNQKTHRNKSAKRQG